MKKSPETKYYTFDTTNPNKSARGCDCVVRSISLAMGCSWEKVFDDLCEIGRKIHRMPSDDKTYEKYLTEQGWICKGQPRKDDNCKYTGKEYMNAYRIFLEGENVIMSIGSGHLSCIINGKIHDIWDCSDYCVGKIWVKAQI